jgi:hypothetical protein
MIVTPAQAGVQFKAGWIPACTEMTHGQQVSLINNTLEYIFWARSYIKFSSIISIISGTEDIK